MSEKYRTTSFFNGVSSFKTAFPHLSDASIEWRERQGPEDTGTLESGKTGYRRGNFTQGVLACSNPLCHEGGYQLDRLIAEMVGMGETERQGTMLCSGRETGEEVRRGPVRCTHRIEFKVTLTQRPEGEERRDREERRPFFRKKRNRPSRRGSAA